MFVCERNLAHMCLAAKILVEFGNWQNPFNRFKMAAALNIYRAIMS